jgi:hypothetical protein
MGFGLLVEESVGPGHVNNTRIQERHTMSLFHDFFILLFPTILKNRSQPHCAIITEAERSMTQNLVPIVPVAVQKDSELGQFIQACVDLFYFVVNVRV